MVEALTPMDDVASCQVMGGVALTKIDVGVEPRL